MLKIPQHQVQKIWALVLSFWESCNDNPFDVLRKSHNWANYRHISNGVSYKNHMLVKFVLLHVWKESISTNKSCFHDYWFSWILFDVAVVEVAVVGDRDVGVDADVNGVDVGDVGDVDAAGLDVDAVGLDVEVDVDVGGVEDVGNVGDVGRVSCPLAPLFLQPFQDFGEEVVDGCEKKTTSKF